VFASIERNSMLGMYRALFPSNVPVDFIHINEIAEGKAGRYKLILLGYPLMITEPAARALIEYVRAGGALMSEARLAWNDDRGYAKEIIPGFGLHEVCGCREASAQQTASGKTDIEILTKDESTPRLEAGDKLRGVIYEEALESISPRARVIARFTDGSPAIVASSYGKGKMLAAGTFLGLSYESERSENLVKFFAGLLDWAGVARPVEVSGVASDQAVEVRTMESGAEKLVFVFNHGSDAVEPAIRVSLPQGAYSVKDLATGQALGAGYERDAVVLKKIITANDVWAVRISPK
jgi:beta-galactosidase